MSFKCYDVALSVGVVPVNIGKADTACKVLHVAARRSSIVERLHGGLAQCPTGRRGAFFLLLVFVIDQKGIPENKDHTQFDLPIVIFPKIHLLSC